MTCKPKIKSVLKHYISQLTNCLKIKNRLHSLMRQDFVLIYINNSGSNLHTYQVYILKENDMFKNRNLHEGLISYENHYALTETQTLD